MDSFHSESISSDSSSADSTLLQSSKKEVRRRKIRATAEFVPVEACNVLEENTTQADGRKWQNNSFLPKISDLLEDTHETKSNIIKPLKLKRDKSSNLSKKAVTMKLRKLKIEGKRFKTKFQAPVDKKRLKNKVSSDDLMQVLSDAAKEFRSDTRMSLKLKRSKEGWKSIIGESRTTPQIVLKDVYVNLIPLEKTNLLNDNQLRQLQCKRMLDSTASPLLSASFSNCQTPFSRKKSYLGKENLCESESVATSKTISKLPKKLQRKNMSLHENFYIHEYFRPCRVILERLSPDKMEFLTLSSESMPTMLEDIIDISVSKSNAEDAQHSDWIIDTLGQADAVKMSDEKLSNVEYLASHSNLRKRSVKRSTVNSDDEVNTSKTRKRISSPGKNRKSSHSKKSVEAFGAFCPEESSSPLVPAHESVAKLDACTDFENVENSNLLPVFVKLTYDSEAAGTEDLTGSADRENLNGTYEIGTNCSSNEAHRTEEMSCLRKQDSAALTNSNEKSRSDRNSELLACSKAGNANSVSGTKNRTYELNDVNANTSKRNSRCSIKNPVEDLTIDKNATFEVETSDSDNCSVHLENDLSNYGNRKSALGSARKPSTGNVLRRTMRRSYSCDITNANLPEENGESLSKTKRSSQFFTPSKRSSLAVPFSTEKKRRSTLTLDESVNDITLLKSTCDSTGTPQKLFDGGKRSHSCGPGSNHTTQNEGLFKKILDRRLKSHSFHEGAPGRKAQPNFSNVTVRKHCSYSENGRPASAKGKTPEKHESSSSSSDSENSSSPWYDVSDFTKIPPEAMKTQNKTDDFKILQNTLGEPSVLSTENSETNLLKINTEDESESPSSLISIASSGSPKSDSFTRETRRVTFNADAKAGNSIKRLTPPKASARIPTPKSMLKSKSSRASGASNRRVTFSNMSVIIVDDSDVSHGSPVPTQFPPEDDSDDSVEELSRFNRASTAGRTPARTRKSSGSPQFNRRGTVGRTPIRIKIPPKGTESSKKIGSRGKTKLGNESMLLSSSTKKSPKKNKMPNFAKIHQKMYEKMLNLEEYSQKKQKRAALLLSGRKPAQVAASSSKKSPNKHIESMTSHLPKKIQSKKQLNFLEVKALPAKQDASKKAQLVSSTPKGKKKELSGYTRYGFKVIANKSVTKKDQVMAVANKVRPPKSTKEENRTEIKGVRSNRRFDLLMKMRQNK